MLNNISFGAKIPIATCGIINKSTGESEAATIYEYDCKDFSDVETIEKIADESPWEYAHCILLSANNKFNNIKKNKYTCENIYALENKDGKTLNLCCTNEGLDETTVNFIETKQKSGYKYCGQNMMATIAQKALNEFKNFIIIHRARQGAWKFYIRNCGFSPTGIQYNSSEIDMIMSSKRFEELVKKTEEKTGKSIIIIG